MRKIKLGDTRSEPVRESDIEKYLCAEVKKLGGMALKWSSMNTRGVPDRIVFIPGGLITFVELKAPGKKQTPLQLQMAEKLKRLGHPVRVIDSKEKVNEFVRNLKEMKELL